MTYQQLQQQGTLEFVHAGNGKYTIHSIINHTTGKRELVEDFTERGLLSEKAVLSLGGKITSGSLDTRNGFFEKQAYRLPAGFRVDMTHEDVTADASYMLGLNEVSGDIVGDGIYRVSPYATAQEDVVFETTGRYQARSFRNVMQYITNMLFLGYQVALDNFVYLSKHTGGGRPKYAPIVHIHDVQGDVSKHGADIRFENDSNLQTRAVNYPLPNLRVILDNFTALQFKFAPGELIEVEFDIVLYAAINVDPNARIQIPPLKR